METLRLKKVKVPQGKSIRVNLNLSQGSLKCFDELKMRQKCKTSSEVFDYLLDFAESASRDGIVPPDESKSRKIFTLNEYTLARLRNAGKKNDMSLDELVDRALLTISVILGAFRLIDEAKQKYFEKSYVIETINSIWENVASLRAGLEAVFKQEYDTGDPENFNFWFADIEGALQEVRDLAEKLFDQMRPEARDQMTGNGQGGNA